MKRGRQPVYSIVIPALEEEELIGSTLQSLHDYLKANGLLRKTEVVVVTADSKDNTASIVRARAKLFNHFQFIEPGSRVGKGRDVKEGMLAATGKYILFTDADLATPLRHILPAFQLLEHGADIVIGERDLPNIHSGIRKFVSLTANTVTRLLVAPNFADTQCGFKGFERDAARIIFERLTVLGWAFDMEVIAIACQNGMHIEKLPVSDWLERKPADKQLAGEDSLNAAFRTMFEALSIAKNRLMRVYKLRHVSTDIPTNE